MSCPPSLVVVVFPGLPLLGSLTLALGVPAQHLLLAGELDHLQDLPTPNRQVLATPATGLGVGVDHHPCLNHNLPLKLGRKTLELLVMLPPRGPLASF